MDSFQDKRKYPRLFFSGEEVALAKIIPAGEEKSFDVRLLNISEGGIGFHLKRTAGIRLKVNDTLQLLTIFGQPHLGNVSEISMEVRWIMDEEYLDHVAAGCEFVNLDTSNRERLQDFVLVALSEHKQQQDAAL